MHGQLILLSQKAPERGVAAQCGGDRRAIKDLKSVSLGVDRVEAVEAVVGHIADAAAGLTGAHVAVVSVTQGPKLESAVTAVRASSKYAEWRYGWGPPAGSGIDALARQAKRPMGMMRARVEADSPWIRADPSRVHHPMSRGWLRVPVVAGDGGRLGLIYVMDKVGGTDFADEDARLLESLAGIVARLVERFAAEL